MVRNCMISSRNPLWVKGKPVGAGSFGVVHLAMNKFTGELFAVKTAYSGPGLRSLENEAEILESLDSPNIISCLGKDFTHEPNGERRLKIFLEYQAGGSISDVLNNFGGLLDESVIRSYTREILLGLDYLHKNNIVHGDIKCKNLLLGTSGHIKLADFGCSRRMNSPKTIDADSKLCWQSIVGTPLWTAPEVLRNEGLCFASDIWSLGCTIIEMATGKAPWSGNKISNPMSAVLRIASGKEVPQFPAKFSREGLDFLAKCLETDPKFRLTSGDLLDHPFVSRNFRKEDAFSPDSILEFGMYESDYDSDEAEKMFQEESRSRLPFLKRQPSRRERASEWPYKENDFASSDDWITVRSG
ncbi:hypothetical protein MKX01_026053 [Papaver californicum]|nr:hypothetical protein MKX01_026053 [Papaver californicum]